MDAPSTSKLSNTAPVTFIKEVVSELKKVNWPTKQETVKLTGLVLAISVLVGAFVGGLDIVFLKISSLLFKR